MSGLRPAGAAQGRRRRWHGVATNWRSGGRCSLGSTWLWVQFWDSTRARRLLPICLEDARAHHFMFVPDNTGGFPACSATRVALTASPCTLSTTTSRWSRSHVPQSQRSRPTSATWAGRSRGPRRWIAISTTTSTPRSPRNSGRYCSIDYNYSRTARHPTRRRFRPPRFPAINGTDVPTCTREAPGYRARSHSPKAWCSAYSAYARGPRRALGNVQLLDREPNGRNRTGRWFRRGATRYRRDSR